MYNRAITYEMMVIKGRIKRLIRERKQKGGVQEGVMTKVKIANTRGGRESRGRGLCDEGRGGGKG